MPSMVIIEFYGYEEKVFQIQDKMSTRGGFLAWLGIMFLSWISLPYLLKCLRLQVELLVLILPFSFLSVFLQEV
jgi:hypothetical protein